MQMNNIIRPLLYDRMMLFTRPYSRGRFIAPRADLSALGRCS